MGSTPASHPAGNRRLRLRRPLRILRRADFDRAMKAGVRLVDERVVCWCVRNDLPHARLGLVVGRRYGNAPLRNRAKRLVREAFRLLQHDLPAGVDFVIAPRIGVPLALPDLQASLRRLAARAARRIDSPGA